VLVLHHVADLPVADVAAVVDVDGWLGFWLRVDGDREGRPLAFDDVESRSRHRHPGLGRC
jgi:hypothetical protein